MFSNLDFIISNQTKEMFWSVKIPPCMYSLTIASCPGPTPLSALQMYSPWCIWIRNRFAISYNPNLVLKLKQDIYILPVNCALELTLVTYGNRSCPLPISTTSFGSGLPSARIDKMYGKPDQNKIGSNFFALFTKITVLLDTCSPCYLWCWVSFDNTFKLETHTSFWQINTAFWIYLDYSCWDSSIIWGFW